MRCCVRASPTVRRLVPPHATKPAWRKSSTTLNPPFFPCATPFHARARTAASLMIHIVSDEWVNSAFCVDGAPDTKKNGGGIFKSVDGGVTWNQLPNQPPKRRVFNGLAIDPTDSNRLYWAVGGAGAGLYSSDDGGQSWQRVFGKDGWIFNVMVTNDGTVYCPGTDLWRSADQGKSWKKLTQFKKDGCVIVGMAEDPENPQRIWIARTNWGNAANGGIYRTEDGGQTWQDITGNLPVCRQLVLRYNPVTRELWTGFPAMHKLQQ